MKGKHFDFCEYMKDKKEDIKLLIYPDGHADYAGEDPIAYCLELLKLKFKDIGSAMPAINPEKWLSKYSKCVIMYPDKVHYFNITKDQICTLRQLKSVGVYHGDVPVYV